MNWPQRQRARLRTWRKQCLPATGVMILVALACILLALTAPLPAPLLRIVWRWR